MRKDGQVFTPVETVELMLDKINYIGDKISKNYIIDNSCGDGAFLNVIVKRYIESFTGDNKDVLRKELETYIHGIEIESSAYNKCIANLDKIAKEYNLENVKWAVVNDDTIDLMELYQDKFDFVVGNPPYIRTKDMMNDMDKIKDFEYIGKGMTDMYLVFYEIGIRMMNNKGKMIYINPSSLINSKAGEDLREYIIKNKLLEEIINFEHHKIFTGRSTYTAIFVLSKENKLNKFIYNLYDSLKDSVDEVRDIPYSEISSNDRWILSRKNNESITEILNDTSEITKVRNGFATLADKIFISKDYNFSGTIDVIKSTTGEKLKAIYPYNNKGQPISFKEYSENHPEAAKVLLENKNKLLKRSIKDPEEWYLFGRTQAINKVMVNKIAISTLFKPGVAMRITRAPSGTGVYGGLFIETPLSFEEVRRALASERFSDFAESLGRYKSGGYYVLVTKELQSFLNHYHNERSVDETNR